MVLVVKNPQKRLFCLLLDNTQKISEGVAPPVRRESSLPAHVFGTHLQTGSVSVNKPDDFWVGGGDNDDDETAELYVILQPL